MDITIKYAIFIFGALIIIAILLHAFSKAPKQSPSQVLKPGAKAMAEAPVSGVPKNDKKEVLRTKASRSAHKTLTEPTLGNLPAHHDHDEALEDEAEAVSEEHSSSEMVNEVEEQESVVEKSYHDITPEVQEELERAAEEALAASRGEPHQVELPFDDHEVVWEDVVKSTFEKRMQKMPEGIPHSVIKPEVSSTHAVNEFVVLNVIAPRSTTFRGPDIIEILDSLGMGFGKHGIYHGFTDDNEIEFSVASVFEPGYFDLSKIQNFSTPGLTFFMDLTRVSEPKAAFKRMLAVVYEVSRRLGGDILDEHRQRLTQANVSEYLARIKGIESRRKNYG